MKQGTHPVVLMTCAVSAVVAVGLTAYAVWLAVWIASAENDTVTTATRVLVAAVPAMATFCFAYAAVHLVRYCQGRQVRAWGVIGAYVAGLAAVPGTYVLYLGYITAG